MLEPFDPKTIHMVRCPFCHEYHRVSLRMRSVGTGVLPKCPETNKTFTADREDWLHLSEDEFHRRFGAE